MSPSPRRPPPSPPDYDDLREGALIWKTIAPFHAAKPPPPSPVALPADWTRYAMAASPPPAGAADVDPSTPVRIVAYVWPQILGKVLPMDALIYGACAALLLVVGTWRLLRWLRAAGGGAGKEQPPPTPTRATVAGASQRAALAMLRDGHRDRGAAGCAYGAVGQESAVGTLVSAADRPESVYDHAPEEAGGGARATEEGDKEEDEASTLLDVGPSSAHARALRREQRLERPEGKAAEKWDP